MTQTMERQEELRSARAPRLGFLGVGWIGRHRLRSVVEAGAGEVVAVADPCRESLEAAREGLPRAAACGSLDALLEQGLDGVVIATPSAMHSEQAIAALERGVAVFCQKPLGRTASEAAAVVDAAARADRPLGVDLSYRHTRGYEAIVRLIRAGELGRIHEVDLVFHNAYGPDKPWFRDPALSGGGCAIDLGVHLVDLALEALGWPDASVVRSDLSAGGRRLRGGERVVEDFAVATLECEGGAIVRLACSWNLHAGRDAVISAEFHGTSGGASLRNVDGSFYDFVAARYRGTASEVLVGPPDAWGGRAIVSWAGEVARGAGFDPAARRFIRVAELIDGIYGR